MGRKEDAAARRVSEVMRSEVATLRIDDRLDLAEDVMRLGRVRHMPVVDGGRLVGIVSNRDLLAASLSRVLDFSAKDRRTFLRSIEVSEVMTRDPIAVTRDASLREAAELMLQHRIGCLPVVSADRTLIGLVTETDLMRAALLSDAEPVEAAKQPGATSRSELAGRLQQEIDELRRVRDELKLRIHLAKADAKDRWAALEQQLQRLEAKGQQIAHAGEASLGEVADAARMLAEEIRDGYRRIRDAL